MIIRMLGLEGLITLMQLASAEDRGLNTVDTGVTADDARPQIAASD